MNPIGLTAVRSLLGIAPSHPAAPWSQSCSHLRVPAPTEPNAVSRPSVFCATRHRIAIGSLAEPPGWLCLRTPQYLERRTETAGLSPHPSYGMGVILPKNSPHPLTKVGTTFGRVTYPAGEAPDLFHALINGKGKATGFSPFEGAVRSWWGNETLVQRDDNEQTWKLPSPSTSFRP